jgi:hypothetical protein
MFTINIYLRFALIAVGLIGGIALCVSQGFWYGFFFVLAAIILLIGYFLLGTLNSATMMMQMGDTAGASKQLDLTFFPNLLYQPVRGGFYLIKATMKLQEQKWDEGEELLQKCIEIGLPSDNETAMVHLQLANIAAQKQQWGKAETSLKKAKSYRITEPSLKEQLEQFDKALTQRGTQLKASVRMGMATGFKQAGSKRRTPRGR